MSCVGLVVICREKWRRAGVTKKLLKVYFVTFCLIFSTAFSLSFVFPFLPFMVQFLLPHVEVTSLGRYTGLIASAASFGRFLSNYIWGAVADSKGHKPVVLISAILTAIASLAFAFSTNFALSVVLRFIIGFFNATSILSKAIISKWSTDDNHALGMSVAITSYGAGTVMGPALSGFLADPLNQYNIMVTNSTIHSFLTVFPYSMPAIISGLLFVFSAVVVIVCLPKPSPPKVTSNRTSNENTSLGNESLIKYDAENESVEVDVTDNTNLLNIKKTGLSNWLKRSLRRLREGFGTYLKDLRMFMCDRSSMLAIATNFIYSFTLIAFEEIYPLWCATPRYAGGLGFSLTQIGVSLSVVGAIIVVFPLFIFPLLDHLIGVVNTFQLCAIINILVMLLLPNLHYLNNIPLMWTLLIFMLVLLRLAYDFSYAAIYIFLNNSVTPDKLGSINGLAGSITAFFRSLSPIFAGIVYSVSLTTGLGYPLNYHLMFIVIAMIILLVMVMVAGFPESIERQKEHKEAQQQDKTNTNDNGEQEEPNETRNTETQEQEEQKRTETETAVDGGNRIQPDELVHVAENLTNQENS